jgi:hypothetical protein
MFFSIMRFLVGLLLACFIVFGCFSTYYLLSKAHFSPLSIISAIILVMIAIGIKQYNAEASHTEEPNRDLFQSVWEPLAHLERLISFNNHKGNYSAIPESQLIAPKPFLKLCILVLLYALYRPAHKREMSSLAARNNAIPLNTQRFMEVWMKLARFVAFDENEYQKAKATKSHLMLEDLGREATGEEIAQRWATMDTKALEEANKILDQPAATMMLQIAKAFDDLEKLDVLLELGIAEELKEYQETYNSRFSESMDKIKAGLGV